MDDSAQQNSDKAGAPAAREEGVLGRVVLVSGAQVTCLLYRPDDPRKQDEGVRVGALVKMRTSESTVFGVVTGLRVTDPALLPEKAEGMVEIELLCEFMDGVGGKTETTFKRGVSVYPQLGADIVNATREELGRIFARPEASHVRIGTIHQDRNLPAYVLTDDLLGKHFAVLGTTGSGKSCSVALILHSILAAHPNGRIVILDPHNEYAQAFEGIAEVVTTSNMELPSASGRDGPALTQRRAARRLRRDPGPGLGHIHRAERGDGDDGERQHHLEQAPDQAAPLAPFRGFAALLSGFAPPGARGRPSMASTAGVTVCTICSTRSGV